MRDSKYFASRAGFTGGEMMGTHRSSRFPGLGVLAGFSLSLLVLSGIVLAGNRTAQTIKRYMTPSEQTEITREGTTNRFLQIGTNRYYSVINNRPITDSQ